MEKDGFLPGLLCGCILGPCIIAIILVLVS